MKKNETASFPEQTVKFLRRLDKNNSREWFEQHRDEYELDFFLPAANFVTELGEKLNKIAPNVHAIPKIDKSIFRLHRDVRFSKNKAPFKTNLGMFLWEGPAPKMEASGFYTHIEPKMFMVACGIYMFTKDNIKIFRDAVDNPAIAKELDGICKKLTKQGYQIGGQKYKKIPKGYDPDYPYAKYLLHDSLHAYYEGTDFTEITGIDFAAWCHAHFKRMVPIHNWLQKHVFKG